MPCGIQEGLDIRGHADLQSALHEFNDFELKEERFVGKEVLTHDKTPSVCACLCDLLELSEGCDETDSDSCTYSATCYILTATV